MDEIEVKVIEVRKDELTKKLEGLGAKKVFEKDISALFYDFEDQRLAREHSYLRMRKIGDDAFITYKRLDSLKKAKIAEEIETQIDDFETIHRILLAIGMRPYADKTKHRTEYILGDVKFEIDEYADIPPYLEIEAPDIDTIYRYVHRLGLPEKNVKSWTSKEMFHYYGIDRSSHMS